MSSSQTAWSQSKGIPNLNISAISRGSRDDFDEGSRPCDKFNSALSDSGGIPNQRSLTKLRSIMSPVHNDHLYVSGEVVARDLALMKATGITHIINAAGDECLNFFPQQFTYLTLMIADQRLVTASLEAILYDTLLFMAAAIDGGGRVLVHCKEGISRSCTYVIAYLMWREKWPFRQALDHVKGARLCCAPNTGFTVSLIKFGKTLRTPGTERPSNPDKHMTYVKLYRVALHHLKAPFHVVLEIDAQDGEYSSATHNRWRVSPTQLDPRFTYVLRSSRRRFYIWESQIRLSPQHEQYSKRAIARFLENVKNFECAADEKLEVMHTRHKEEPIEFLELLEKPLVKELENLVAEVNVCTSGTLLTWESYQEHLKESKYQFNPEKILSPRPSTACR